MAPQLRESTKMQSRDDGECVQAQITHSLDPPACVRHKGDTAHFGHPLLVTKNQMEKGNHEVSWAYSS
jgi:hypothetical protein